MTEHKITIVGNAFRTRFIWRCSCGEQGRRFVKFRGNATQEGNIHKGLTDDGTQDAGSP